MRRVSYLDYAEFCLSQVLTKFLTVRRSLCAKKQSHDHYLDCAKITNQSHELYLEFDFYCKTRAMCTIWNTFYSALKSIGINKRTTDGCLVLIWCIEIALKSRLLVRRGKSIYYPIVFSQFGIGLGQGRAGAEGYWRQWGFGMAAMYKSDFLGMDLSIVGWGKEDVSLYEKYVLQSNLEILRQDCGFGNQNFE